MNHPTTLKRIVPISLICALAAGSIAWQSHSGAGARNAKDTIPERQKRVRDIDNAIEDLDKGKAAVEQSLRTTDWQQLQQDLQTSLKEIQLNTAKMQEEIKASMETLRSRDMQKDLEEARRGIEEAEREVSRNTNLKQEDLRKVQEDLARALVDIDMKKVQQETERTLASVNMEKVQEALERTKEIDMEKIQQKLADMGPEIERSMHRAQEGIERAREEMASYKALIDALDRDGLIHKNGNYTIEYKKGDLIINGEKQSDSIETATSPC